jgi:methylase of polypeptide subunit release factors
MALPDVSRLQALEPAAWRALGARLLAVGLGKSSPQAPIFHDLAIRAFDPLRSPMAKWHARRHAEPGGYANRMFAMADPVTVDEARAALGDASSLERLLEAGLLVRSGAGVVSPYILHVCEDTLIFCDDLTAGGSDAVMGCAQSTFDLIRAARPAAPVGRMLDLGCGAGSLALVFASRCERVVATDINPRAIELARVNAWANGIENVEFRTGDLFEPVAGEVFDLVVSQPPFIAQYEDTPATWMFGGPRGDEIPLRVLRGVRTHLSPGGVAVVLVDWPVMGGDPPVEERVREALGDAPDTSVLVVQACVTNLDDHCLSYALFDGSALREDYERRAMLRRDHFERMKIRSLRIAYNVVRRAADGAAGWTSTLSARESTTFDVHRDRIDAAIAARDLCSRGTRALLGARLRVMEGVAVEPDESGGGKATFPERALVPPLAMSAAVLAVVNRIHAANSVKAAIESLAAEKGAPPQAVAESILPGVQHALLYGLLEVAPR